MTVSLTVSLALEVNNLLMSEEMIHKNNESLFILLYYLGYEIIQDCTLSLISILLL